MPSSLSSCGTLLVCTLRSGESAAAGGLACLPSVSGATEISVFFGTALGCLTETQAFLILNALPNIGPITLNRLLAALGGGPRAVLSATVMCRRPSSPLVVGLVMVTEICTNPPGHQGLMESKGVMTGKDAKQQNVGGEVLAEVF